MIYLGGRRDVVVEGLEIRGCVDGIAIVDSANVMIEPIYFQKLRLRTRVYGDLRSRRGRSARDFDRICSGRKQSRRSAKI